MSTVKPPLVRGKHNRDASGRAGDFDLVAAPFLHDPGLPFAKVLDADTIAAAFRAEDALFGDDDIFSTAVVLWAFLAQVLCDGKESACTAAVANIGAYLLQTGRRPPCGDTGDYCRARAKLNPAALRRLVRDAADALEAACDPAWRWHGRSAKLVDGFTFTMPDTPENRETFPQNPAQAPGVGLPIARACAVTSLATGCVCDLALGPYLGKQTGETALFREIDAALVPGDVAVFDRYLCSYWTLARLPQRGVDVCARVHQCRTGDFRIGPHLGEEDHLATWVRPARPAWMSREEYAQDPETLTVRELRFAIEDPRSRVDSITLVTTFTDPVAHIRRPRSRSCTVGQPVRPLWLPQDHGAAPARGLEGEPQARRTDLAASRLTGAEEASGATRRRAPLRSARRLTHTRGRRDEHRGWYSLRGQISSDRRIYL